MEGYVGTGGDFGAPAGVKPSGGAMTGKAGGVDNQEVYDEMFVSYIDDVVAAVFNQCNVSEDGAYQAVVTVASMKASEGMLPPMPSMSAKPELLAAWSGAAKTAGFCDMVISYCNSRGG
jgi:hypothetical protein